MDNLTHSLVGALIGQTGLKKLSGLGMPTLIIAANIPDIDATCTVYGIESLAMRRGLTHGPIAMLLLPALLTAIMVAFDRWQARRGQRPVSRAPVRFAPLLLLAVIGTLSHPFFDWLNSYGVRLLEPFSSRWFHGDSIFIIDLWMWVVLIGGVVWSRRAEKRGGDWRKRGRIAATLLGGYILLNGAITEIAERRTAAAVRARHGVAPALVVANPVPVAFWQRDMLWRGSGVYGGEPFNLIGGAVPKLLAEPAVAPTPIGMDDPCIAAAAARDPALRAFLFWSRMPIAMRAADGSIVVRDQRFANPLTGDRFSVRIPAEAPR